MLKYVSIIYLQYLGFGWTEIIGKHFVDGSAFFFSIDNLSVSNQQGIQTFTSRRDFKKSSDYSNKWYEMIWDLFYPSWKSLINLYLLQMPSKNISGKFTDCYCNLLKGRLWFLYYFTLTIHILPYWVISWILLMGYYLFKTYI